MLVPPLSPDGPPPSPGTSVHALYGQVYEARRWAVVLQRRFQAHYYKSGTEAHPEDLTRAIKLLRRVCQDIEADVAKLDAEEAKHAKEAAESSKTIAELTAKLDDAKDKLDKCGDSEKKKIAEMQKANREAVEKYDALNKKVCEMLKQFEIPSDTSDL